MKQIQHIILTLLLLLSSLTVFSQSNYPIYVTPTLTPPYSLRLSDYSTVGSQNLMVQINVNDLNITDLPVKLRIKMETAGVSIETPPTITTTPIYLNGGVTSILFGEDLRDYFHINNLVFKGYSKEAYKRSGQLPGGFYKFTVEVLHYNTNRLISNSGTTSVWITLGKPPVLKSPANDEQLGQFQGMPLTFAWLASNVGSPVSSGSIQYTFEMWEMRINGINPNTIAQSMPVFHEEKTFNTFCQIYPATLMLEPGMRYAWRITASDISGYIPFEQNGHSEIRTFMYKATCDSVTHLNAKARGSSATFVWDTEPNHTSFNVELRQPDTGWLMNSETYDNKAEFFELEQGQSYEMRVQAVCNADPSTVSDYSQWTKVKIPVQKPLIDTLNCPTCGCDDNMPQVELTNFDLRTDLSPGDTLSNKTGTTRFIINKAEPQGEGSYTGIFYYWAEIWGIKFVCEYENLQVNTDNVIVNMDFESVYDPQYLLDVDELSDYLNDLADDVANLTTGITVKDSIVYEQDFDAVYVNAGDSLIAVSVDENGNITETTLASSTDDLDKTLVKDKNGDAFVVTGKGEAMGVDEFKATGGNSRLLKKHNEEKESKLANGMVTFKASGDQRYGFDTYCEIKSPLQQHYTSLNNGYRPAWKSLPAYGTDVVAADAYEGITFKDEMGIPAIPSGEKLNLRGSFDGAEVPLYAYKDTSTVAGKLNMVSYGPKTNKLYIVPVNGATLPNVTELKNTLNSIYAQAVMQWDVQAIQEPVQVSFPGGNMTHGGSGSISTYNADQKAIIKAYTSGGRALERNAFYLFFVDNVSDKGSNIAGYMPLQRQCGFIYGNPKLNTIAHELAHGAFNLYHTFSTHGYIAPEGKTQNLMDYTNGATELWKHQWDKIHNPQDILFGFMVDEEEGEAFKDKGTAYVCLKDESALARINKYTKFYLADGRVVDLAGKAKASGFFTVEDQTEGAPGTLAAIASNGKDNIHLFSGRKTRGFGYTISSKSAMLTYSAEKLLAEDTTNAVKVLIDNSKKLVKIKSGEKQLEQFNYQTICNCDAPDPSKEIHFTFDKNTSHYVDFAMNNAIKIQHQFHEETEIINSLLEVINQQSQINNKDESFLGEILADKLKTYEVFNDRKFIVAPVRVNQLSLDQNSWNLLAKRVFKDANLSAKDILITIPYIQCQGIGRDLGEYYFMPGVAYGDDIEINFSALRNDYINTQRVAEFAAGIINPVEGFIVDVFRHTKKKMLLYKAIFNASNTVECAVVLKEGITGQAFNKTVRLYKQNAVEELSQLIVRQNKEIEKREKEYNEFIRNPYVSVAQKNTAGHAMQMRLKECMLVHAEEKLNFIRVNATDKAITPYQTKFFDLKIREEFIDEPFEHKRTNQLEVGYHIFALAYVYTDAFNELREQLGYPSENLSNDWNGEWSFNSKTDYILKQYDQTIYNGLDGASLVIGCFGLDFVTDGLGLAYSIMRGDIAQAGGYTAGLVVVGPESVVVVKASASALVLLFTKQAIEEVGEEVGKKVLLKLAQKYVDEGAISKEVFDGLKNLEEKELAAAIKNALKGQLDNLLTDRLRSKIQTKLGSKADEFIGAVQADAYLAALLKESEDDILNTSVTFLAQGRTTLFKKPDALKAFINIKKCSSETLQKLGLTDKALTTIRGHSNSSFSGVINDLNKFITKLEESPNTIIDGFDKNILNKLQLTGNNANKIQGAHGVVKALSDDFDLLKGKTVKFEQSVDNMRGTKSFEDMTIEIVTIDGPMILKRIEVKNCSNCITSQVIKEQFIERDLFSAKSIEQIRWRIYGQNFTKEDLLRMLEENKDVIKKLGEAKVKQLLPSKSSQINKNNFKEILITEISNDNVFNKIFK